MTACGLDDIEVDKDDWWQIVEKARETNQNCDPVTALHLYGVCIESLITRFSRDALALYARLGGLSRLMSPEQFFDQPALWVNICDTIDTEFALVKKGMIPNV